MDISRRALSGESEACTTFLPISIARSPRIVPGAASAGFVVGLATMIVVIAGTSIDYTWHTLIGCGATILAAGAFSLLRFPPFSRDRSAG